MRDISVAPRVDSADRRHIIYAIGELPERMRLRKRTYGALDAARGDVDLQILGQIVCAHGDADAGLLEQVGEHRGLERAGFWRQLYRQCRADLVADPSDQLLEAFV